MRYSLRIGRSLLPSAEITVGTLVSISPWKMHYEVVKRKYGFSKSHAMSRAIAWTREHGDPR